MVAEPEPYVQLLREVVAALERTAAEQRALAAVSSTSTSELRRLTDSVAAMTALWKAEQESDNRSTRTRNKAVATLWASQPMQTLLMGLVLAVLQVLGVAWYAHQVPVGHAPTQIEVPTP